MNFIKPTDNIEELDPYFFNALKLAIDMGKISTSLLQRKLPMGYGRAAKIIDKMDELGYLAPSEQFGPRKVLLTYQDYIDLTGDNSILEETDNFSTIPTKLSDVTPISIYPIEEDDGDDDDEEALSIPLSLFSIEEEEEETEEEQANSVCIFLADGFEMIETLTPCDILRRAGLNVRLVSVSGKPYVRSTHGVDVKTDLSLGKLDPDAIDMIILPGGMPGAKNLYENKALMELVLHHVGQNKPIAAICAAPFILGKLGLLQGKNATCYPGFEQDLLGATCLADGVVKDGNIITAKGMGVSLDFALAICELLCGKDKRDEIAKAIMMA